MHNGTDLSLNQERCLQKLDDSCAYLDMKDKSSHKVPKPIIISLVLIKRKATV